MSLYIMLIYKHWEKMSDIFLIHLEFILSSLKKLIYYRSKSHL